MKRQVTLLISATLACSSLAFSDGIHDAAESGDLGRVKALLKARPDFVFSRDEIGWTPLHEAASMGHKDVVEYLLTKGRVVAVQNPEATNSSHR